MWHVRLIALVVCLAGQLFGASSVTAADGQLAAVTNIRLGDHGTMTRVVLDITSPLSARIFTLREPYRVVVDLPEVDWQVLGDGAGLKGGVVESLRFGLFQPGTSRLVLDTAAPVKVANTFTLDPSRGLPYRFVLDLERVSADEFDRLAALAPPAPSPVAPAAVVSLPPVPERPSRKPMIVIDAGHGGVDPGAIGRSGTQEKRVTLAMALELRKQLEGTGRYRVSLTRETDVFLRLQERVQKARAAGADLFLSIHADSHPKATTRGLSVYTLSEKASDREAERLARRENKADLIAGMDLSTESAEVTGILIDLAQRETMNMSARFAGFAVDELSREVELLDRTHRFAGFVVLKAPDVPSVLVELGYLSNPTEEKNLNRAEYRAQIARSLVRAIDSYFNWKTALHRS